MWVSVSSTKDLIKFEWEDTMGKKRKSLCDWKKTGIVEDLESYRELVKAPEFVCKDCGRVAGQKKWLCKPMALGKS